MHNKHLYRQAALNKLSRPDQLDQLLRVTSLRSWIALVGVLFVLTGISLWSVFGSLPVYMTTGGILVRQDGFQQVYSPQSGQLTTLRVHTGEIVQAGQLLATVTTGQGEELSLTSPARGTILQIMKPSDNAVLPGKPLFMLDPTDRPLEAVVLVPLAQAKSLRTGLKVELTPTNVLSQQSYLLGTVSDISALPVSQEEIAARLAGFSQLAQVLGGAGPVLEVTVKLETATSSVNGYQWSSKEGSQLKLDPITLCSARLTLAERRPISFILPVLQN